jgi:hypothetical protein
MKTFLKHLFCNHIYKGIDRELLYWKRELDGGRGWGNLPTYSNYVYSALTEKCMKCEKVKITTHKQNIGRSEPKAEYNLLQK